MWRWFPLRRRRHRLDSSLVGVFFRVKAFIPAKKCQQQQKPSLSGDESIPKKTPHFQPFNNTNKTIIVFN